MVFEVVRIMVRQVAGLSVLRIESAHPDVAQIPNTTFDRIQLVVVRRPQPVKFRDIAVQPQITNVS